MSETTAPLSSSPTTNGSAPRPIPQEETQVHPLPQAARCEPLVLEKRELARRVLPLLPQSLRDHYVALEKTKHKPALELLAWDLGAEHSRGGLNSRNQRTRTRVYNPREQRYTTKNITDWEHITRAEAFRFIAGYHTFRGNGQYDVAHTALTSALMTFVPEGQRRPILESIFFPEAPMAGAARRAVLRNRLLPAAITGVSDGDTVKVIVERANCEDEAMTVRFAGIDTPEKFRSAAKFWPQVGAIMNEWKEQKLIRPDEMQRGGPVETLLANRMEFAGQVSSLVMRDFLLWAAEQNAHFAVEETYNRVRRQGDGAQACDMVSLYGNYLRGIWVIRTLQPELLTRYIDTRLAEVMGNGGNLWWERSGARFGRAPSGHCDSTETDARCIWFDYADDGHAITNGNQLWHQYQLDWQIAHGNAKQKQAARAAKAKLAQLRREGRHQLADLLDPAKIPHPAQLYAPPVVEQLGKIYRVFLLNHPDRAGDINAWIVAIGASYAYTKYRNNLSDAYLEVSGVVRQQNLGLWGEATMDILDPNIRVVNKQTRRFEPFVMPPDCTRAQ